ncbi:MAG: hypothetical protein JST92_20195 [Deltaproteobacteria bacterium]|nr:hypothetical protein [Deltaproteobacteria bacterium]
MSLRLVLALVALALPLAARADAPFTCEKPQLADAPQGANPAQEAAAKAYALEAPVETLRLHKGTPGSAHIAIVPKGDAHVDPHAPVTLTVTAGPNVELPKASFNKTDAKYENSGLQLDVPIQAKNTGTETVQATLKFFICTANLCEPQKKTVTIAVNVD